MKSPINLTKGDSIPTLASSMKSTAETSSILDLTDEAVLCIFDAISEVPGKRTLSGKPDGGWYEANPGAWRLAQAHPRFRHLFLKVYVKHVAIHAPHLGPTAFFDSLFASEHPVFFHPNLISKLHINRAICLDNIPLDGSRSVSSLPMLKNVQDLRITHPFSLSDFFLDAIPECFPNVTCFHFSSGSYGVLYFDAFLAALVDAWKESLTVLNLSGVNGVLSTLEPCFAKIAEFRNLESLDLSNWSWSTFGADSLQASDITPLGALTGVRRLHLKSCSLSPASFAAVMKAMTSLRDLNLLETSLGPDLVEVLPASIETLRAGKWYTGGPSNRSTRSAVLPFSARRLPNLRNLEWGYWRDCMHSWSVFEPIAEQLEDLRVHGPEYESAGFASIARMKRLKVLCMRSCDPFFAPRYLETLLEMESIEVYCYGPVGGACLFEFLRVLRQEGVSLRNLVLRVEPQWSRDVARAATVLKRRVPKLTIVVDVDGDGCVPYLDDVTNEDDVIRHGPIELPAT